VSLSDNLADNGCVESQVEALISLLGELADEDLGDLVRGELDIKND
jgi:hypothetical protein